MRYSPEQVREILRLDAPSDPSAAALQLLAAQVPGLDDPLPLSVATLALVKTDDRLHAHRTM